MQTRPRRFSFKVRHLARATATMIAGGILTTATPSLAAPLTLDDYLNQVRTQNDAYQSQVHASEGAGLLGREADLLFTPQFFANAQKGYDEKIQSPAVFQYDRLNSESYSMGLSQQFSMGLEAKLSYLVTSAELEGADMTLLQGVNRFSDGTMKLELSLPLWKNGFGRGAVANESLIRQQALAARYSSAAQANTMINDAEDAYWRLVAAVEQLKIEEQSVKASQNILNYVTERKRKDLGDTADVLQATALVDAYALQLLRAQNEYRSAQRNFNLFLNRPSLDPVPELTTFDFNALESVEIAATRPGDRADVIASSAQAELARANSVVATERNRPSLDVYGAVAGNGKATEISEAMNKTNAIDRETAYVGLRFTMPLNFSAQADAQRGAKQNQLAAEENLRYLKYSQEQKWTDLVQKLSEAKQTLKLSHTMERAQKAKLDNERTRLRQGRTTTYQVLLFEQDYNQAQAARIRAASEILNLQAESKLYAVQGGK